MVYAWSIPSPICEIKPDFRCRPPAPFEKTWGTRRGDVLVPLFAAVAFAGLRGAGVGRIGGDFPVPRGSGGRKTPTPFLARFRRTGAGGGAPKVWFGRIPGRRQNPDWASGAALLAAKPQVNTGGKCKRRRGDGNVPCTLATGRLEIAPPRF